MVLEAGCEGFLQVIIALLSVAINCANIQLGQTIGGGGLQVCIFMLLFSLKAIYYSRYRIYSHKRRMKSLDGPESAQREDYDLNHHSTMMR